MYSVIIVLFDILIQDPVYYYICIVICRIGQCKLPKWYFVHILMLDMYIFVVCIPAVCSDFLHMSRFYRKVVPKIITNRLDFGSSCVRYHTETE